MKSISNSEAKAKGEECYRWAESLFPICRSITGAGFRETLDFFQNLLSPMKSYSIPSGERVFDWIVPDEWNITDAYIENSEGKRVVDFADNNLHVVGYSTAIDEYLTLDQLQKHLHSIPDQPNAIPYVTSYYERKWGFCLKEDQRKELKPGLYRAVINSTLEPGHLNYGELLIPGKSKKEVFLSSYICHPSMANNELSGPTLLAAISEYLLTQKDLKYSYRIVFIPETIGSIAYLSKNVDWLKENVVAGFNLSCIGDDGPFSYVSSRHGNTIADEIVDHVLRNMDPAHTKYSWLDRGSDERQYCSPGIDLPVVGLCRSKYGEYSEYHTSLDDMQFISPVGLGGSYLMLSRIIQILERNEAYASTVLCEPQLGKRGLYPSTSKKGSSRTAKPMTNLLSYCDGKKSLLEISNIIGVPFWESLDLCDTLLENQLLTKA